MENWEKLRLEMLEKINAVRNEKEMEQLRVEILGKKGVIQGYMSRMRELSPEERKEFGKSVNELKNSVETYMKTVHAKLKEAALEEAIKREKIDLTLEGVKPYNGSLHPLDLVQQEIEDIFVSMGYSVVTGPEVEINLYNFERANTPAGHPARAMQDTFFIDEDRLMRTQTTAVQMRALEKYHDHLPIKIICPGKVYRRDDDDATHSHQFSQIEGLVVAEHITLGDLKGTLELMCRRMFGEEQTIRFRPSYFPFTEPSVEVDVSCPFCHGKGCNVCKGSGWIEILGAGMVHPKVLSAAGIDPEKYTGFAFGVGVERIAMLRYGVDDIRDFFQNDVRFLSEFNREE
ncbi:MAG: phenylalanine--tRNA ligase subunit alpha [Erysipelotrichales bacterium]|nr:phenylalanine--tRNA ligase subunit alpha [Erysipelotrichales bacterium]